MRLDLITKVHSSQTFLFMCALYCMYMLWRYEAMASVPDKELLALTLSHHLRTTSQNTKNHSAIKGFS